MFSKCDRKGPAHNTYANERECVYASEWKIGMVDSFKLCKYLSHKMLYEQLAKKKYNKLIVNICLSTT